MLPSYESSSDEDDDATASSSSEKPKIRLPKAVELGKKRLRPVHLKTDPVPADAIPKKKRQYEARVGNWPVGIHVPWEPSGKAAAEIRAWTRRAMLEMFGLPATQPKSNEEAAWEPVPVFHISLCRPFAVKKHHIDPLFRSVCRAAASSPSASSSSSHGSKSSDLLLGSASSSSCLLYTSDAADE